MGAGDYQHRWASMMGATQCEDCGATEGRPSAAQRCLGRMRRPFRCHRCLETFWSYRTWFMHPCKQGDPNG